MKIGQVASEAGVSVDTVRYYERRGILPEPERLPSGYRVYAPAVIERLRFARRLQELGLTLNEVADALHADDAGDASCDTQRWRLEAVLERIEEQRTELDALHAEVCSVLADCDKGCCHFSASG